MARPVMNFCVDLKIEYVAISKDELPAWRAGLLLLLDLLKEEKEIRAREVRAEAGNEIVGVDRDSKSIGGIAPLFPLAQIASRKRTAAPGSVHAGSAGHDDPIERLVVGAQ